MLQLQRQIEVNKMTTVICFQHIKINMVVSAQLHRTIPVVEPTCKVEVHDQKQLSCSMVVRPFEGHNKPAKPRLTKFIK